MFCTWTFTSDVSNLFFHLCIITLYFVSRNFHSWKFKYMEEDAANVIFSSYIWSKPLFFRASLTYIGKWKNRLALNSTYNRNPKLSKVMWRPIGKGVLFKTFDVKVQVHFVPELWRQTFWKVLLFLWNVTYINLLIYSRLFSFNNNNIRVSLEAVLQNQHLHSSIFNICDKVYF